MGARAMRPARITHHHEQEQNQTIHCDVHEDYMDDEYEDQEISTQARKRATQAAPSRAHQKRKTLASY